MSLFSAVAMIENGSWGLDEFEPGALTVALQPQLHQSLIRQARITRKAAVARKTKSRSEEQ
jgi:hypothetical protein